MSSEFSNILTVVEYGTVLVVYSISLYFIVRILVALYMRTKCIALQEKNGLSNMLIANLVCWTILMGSALPHVSVMIAHWRPIEGRLMSPYIMFWTTIVTECMMAAIPYSLFFLTLDRIFSIQYLIGYAECHKLWLLTACVFTLVLIFTINMFAFLQIMPLPPTTDCNVFACLMTNGNTTFIVSKLSGGIILIFAAAYFLLKLRKKTAVMKANQKNLALPHTSKIEPDTLVTLMICTELCLNFVPQLIIFIIQTVIGHQIATVIGPINHFLNSFDGLISALTYRHTLHRFIKADAVTSLPASNSLQQQQEVGRVFFRAFLRSQATMTLANANSNTRVCRHPGEVGDNPAGIWMGPNPNPN